MDLSKACDSVPHDLLVAKFEAYGIDKNRLNMIHSYPTNCKQRTKISSSYSDWYDLVKSTILRDVKYDVQKKLKWFKVNSVKPNPKKFQFMILGKSTRQSIILNINNDKGIFKCSFTTPHN